MEPKIITRAEREAKKLAAQEVAAQASFPSNWQMLKNLAGSLGDLVTDGIGQRSPEEIEAVLKICAACLHYREKGPRCAKCGCYVLLKSRAAALHCPIGKW